MCILDNINSKTIRSRHEFFRAERNLSLVAGSYVSALSTEKSLAKRPLMGTFSEDDRAVNGFDDIENQ